MSDLLANTSLRLAGYGKDLKSDKKKQKRNKYKGALSLIPLKHRFVPKQDKTDVSSILGRSDNTSSDKSKKSSKTDPVEENVRKLIMLSGKGTNKDSFDKILNRAQSKKRIPKKEEKPTTSETTVFTEEDFKKFEKEYFE